MIIFSWKKGYISVMSNKKSYKNVGFQYLEEGLMFQATAQLVVGQDSCLFEFEFFEYGGIYVVFFYSQPHNTLGKFKLICRFGYISLGQVQCINE